MTGYLPETGLLAQVGVPIDAATGIPAHDPAHDGDTVPGVYLAGVIASGFEANDLHRERPRPRGPDRLAACSRSACVRRDGVARAPNPASRDSPSRESCPDAAHPDVMDKLVSLCKRRGFIFQSSEIYGGTGSVWDYGPLGVELKKNIKDRWWHAMVRARDDIEGLEPRELPRPVA